MQFAEGSNGKASWGLDQGSLTEWVHPRGKLFLCVPLIILSFPMGRFIKTDGGVKQAGKLLWRDWFEWVCASLWIYSHAGKLSGQAAYGYLALNVTVSKPLDFHPFTPHSSCLAYTKVHPWPIQLIAGWGILWGQVCLWLSGSWKSHFGEVAVSQGCVRSVAAASGTAVLGETRASCSWVNREAQ